MHHRVIRLLFIAVAALAPIALRAQAISGVVYRAGSDTVIAHASVYYGGSLTGTSTNSNGAFHLQQLPGRVPFVVSSVGYYSTVVSSYKPGEIVKVYLKPKVNRLRMVTIGGTSREEMERMFIREFIGVSDNSAATTILNLPDIDLEYHKKTATLNAFCDKPIEIENKRLGYHITYYLDKFVKTGRNIVFRGNYIFIDEATAANQKKIAHNREDAYDGSRMQFIRALWSNTLNKQGYRIYTPYLTPWPVDSILSTDKSGIKVINLKFNITIIHDNQLWLQTKLGQTSENCLIDERGFYGADLQWFGYMGTQRIGDLLPFEYQSPKDTEDNRKATHDANVVTKENLMAALHPDVPVYQPKKFNKEVELFKKIVLAPNNLLDPQLVVKKWQTPIFYKVYGTFDDETNLRIDSTFNQLARLTGLQITKVTADSCVNFAIISHRYPEMAKIMRPEVISYFKGNTEAGPAYYFANEKGFSNMIQLIRPVPGASTWTVIQKQIVRGMGFVGTTPDYFKSVFFEEAKAAPIQFQTLDARIIKTFYDGQIKSGMTEQQLDDILTRIQLEQL